MPFVILIFPIVTQFYPAPSPPYNLAGPICAAWLILGVIIVIILNMRAPAALARSGKVYLDESGES